MTAVRILVTGSRDWTDPYVVAEAIDGHYAEDAVVVHGDCPTGADRHAREWCEFMGVAHEPHPADWNRYGKSAGFVRNAEMVNLGADVVLAFIRPCVKAGCPDPQPHDSHGAAGTVRLARDNGLPVVMHRA